MRNWLVAIRDERGFKQRDVAKLVGISQPTYCYIESGKRGPGVDVAKRIAAVLGFEWTKFFEDGR